MLLSSHFFLLLCFAMSWWNSSHARRSSARYKIASSSALQHSVLENFSKLIKAMKANKHPRKRNLYLSLVQLKLLGSLHVVWQVSFGCWITWSISSWQNSHKSVFFPKAEWWVFLNDKICSYTKKSYLALGNLAKIGT